MATRKSKKSKSKAPNDENSFNYTLNDSYGMDSFDKMVEVDKKPLRERNILKRNVRISYNRDSSLENPSTDEEADMNDVMVVASTPRFKSAPKSYSRGRKKSSANLLKPPSTAATGFLHEMSSKLSGAKDMFFNFISTPANRKSEQSLNLSVIVSSEGEPSMWQKFSFQNMSKYMPNKRRSSPVAGEDDARKMLKTPDKEKEKKTKKKRSTKTRASNNRESEAKGRKSEKPRVLFNLVNEEESEAGEDHGTGGAAGGRKTENFVLKGGKWRKSIANIRRTIHTAEENGGGARASVVKPKQSVMFAVPEGTEEDGEGVEDGDVHGRWTKGPRISQYHPGRRRKSIFIAPRAESIIVIDEVDDQGHNQSNDGELNGVNWVWQSEFLWIQAELEFFIQSVEQCSLFIHAVFIQHP